MNLLLTCHNLSMLKGDSVSFPHKQFQWFFASTRYFSISKAWQPWSHLQLDDLGVIFTLSLEWFSLFRVLTAVESPARFLHDSSLLRFCLVFLSCRPVTVPGEISTSCFPPLAPSVSFPYGCQVYAVSGMPLSFHHSSLLNLWYLIT